MNNKKKLKRKLVEKIFLSENHMLYDVVIT